MVSLKNKIAKNGGREAIGQKLRSVAIMPLNKDNYKTMNKCDTYQWNLKSTNLVWEMTTIER